MSKVSLFFYYLFMILLFIFGLWYLIKAPCSFIKDFMWGTGEVPARCINIK